jgi:hypothetical protein
MRGTGNHGPVTRRVPLRTVVPIPYILSFLSENDRKFNANKGPVHSLTKIIVIHGQFRHSATEMNIFTLVLKITRVVETQLDGKWPIFILFLQQTDTLLHWNNEPKCTLKPNQPERSPRPSWQVTGLWWQRNKEMEICNKGITNLWARYSLLTCHCKKMEKVRKCHWKGFQGLGVFLLKCWFAFDGFYTRTFYPLVWLKGMAQQYSGSIDKYLWTHMASLFWGGQMGSNFIAKCNKTHIPQHQVWILDLQMAPLHFEFINP